MNCPYHGESGCPVCPYEQWTNSRRAAQLEACLRVAEEALEKVKNGGVPFGVHANMSDRMLVACEVSVEALAMIAKMKGSLQC